MDRAGELRHQPTHAYHLRRAACLERAGDLEAAQRERSVATLIKPNGAFDHFLSGLEYYKQASLPEAKLQFEAALGAQPNHFWAQCLLAICNLNARPPRPAEARAYLTACLQSHPDLAWLYLLRGFASGQSGVAAATETDGTFHFEAALADYREVVKRDPDGRFRYALLANRGLVRFQSGKLAEAAADLKDAIALNPRQLNAHVTLRSSKGESTGSSRRWSIWEKPSRSIRIWPRCIERGRRWRLEVAKVTPEVRAAAMADLAEAIKRETQGSRELAEDHAETARVMILDKQYEQALTACDLSLQINPDSASVQQWRVMALLELKRYQAAADSCDAYLRTGHRSAEILGLRGLAKAKRDDFAGAIDDYTLAISLQPEVSALHCRRGWAYLISGAYPLARRDFEEAIRLDPSSSDAYGGRGSALVALGLYHEAVADADESFRHGEIESRMIYTAARILAQAARWESKESHACGRPDLVAARRFQDRALRLLEEALRQTPQAERAAFWRDVVATDPAFWTIHRLPDYARLAAEYGSRTL